MSQCLFFLLDAFVVSGSACICFLGSREVDFNQRWMEKPEINQRMRRNKGSNGTKTTTTTTPAMALATGNEDRKRRRPRCCRRQQAATSNFLMKKNKNPSEEPRWTEIHRMKWTNERLNLIFACVFWVSALRNSYLLSGVDKPDDN